MKTKIASPEIVLDGPKLAFERRVLPSKRWLVRRVLVIFLSMLLLGGSAIPVNLARFDYFGLAVGGHSWDLLGWEAGALSSKVEAAFSRPADHVSTTQAATMIVKEYLNRAARI